MTAVEPADLAEFLAEHPPFDSLDPEALDEIARAARVERFDDAALIHDAFTSRPTRCSSSSRDRWTSCGTTAARCRPIPATSSGPVACSASGRC